MPAIPASRVGGASAATRRWVPSGPLDVRLTVMPLRRGGTDPAFRITPDGAVWRASRTPQGPATLRITGSPAALEGHAWGPGAQWLLDAMPGLLGA
ncbi:MAG: DNA-3-methyladenine glycosylase 2 family protein, partial [Actinomycetia bacterium]|nr:DNA-3-methyladenine glycosylase 2 family protein [Actinomycetes bacterium]